MKTVKDLLQALQGVDPSTPILVDVAQSGTLEETVFSLDKFRPCDEDAGIENLEIGTPIFKFYI